MPTLRRAIKIDIQIQAAFPTAFRPLLKKAAKAAIEGLPQKAWKKTVQGRASASVCISIVTPLAIRKMNRDFREKDRPTDVLSFPSAPMPGSDFVGDILLCWTVARGQTDAFQTTPKEEVQRLVVHGVLHLFGYDHETSLQDEKRMFRLQNAILAKLPRDRGARLSPKGK